MFDFRTHTRVRANLFLLLLVPLTASTFLVIKHALVEVAPFSLNFFRFALAAVFLLFFLWNKLTLLNWALIKWGALAGLLLGAAQSLQAYGLQYLPTGQAAFISSMAVVLVPLFEYLIFRRKPGAMTAGAVGLAVVGLALLCLNGPLQAGMGNIFLLLCAAGFALFIMTVSHAVRLVNAFELVFVQIIFGGIVAGGAAFYKEHPSLYLSTPVWLALLYLGVAATGFRYVVQNHLQQFNTATDTQTILTTEPVIAAILGFAIAGERMTFEQIAGCFLIITGTFLISLVPQSTHNGGVVCRLGTVPVPGEAAEQQEHR